jgi:hypothetical protein
MINFNGARFDAQKLVLTTHFGALRADDYETHMTSFVILVI